MVQGVTQAHTFLATWLSLGGVVPSEDERTAFGSCGQACQVGVLALQLPRGARVARSLDSSKPRLPPL